MNEDITVAFGVPGENEIERRVVDICTERGLGMVTVIHKGTRRRNES